MLCLARCWIKRTAPGIGFTSRKAGNRSSFRFLRKSSMANGQSDPKPRFTSSGSSWLGGHRLDNSTTVIRALNTYVSHLVPAYPWASPLCPMFVAYQTVWGFRLLLLCRCAHCQSGGHPYQTAQREFVLNMTMIIPPWVLFRLARTNDTTGPSAFDARGERRIFMAGITSAIKNVEMAYGAVEMHTNECVVEHLHRWISLHVYYTWNERKWKVFFMSRLTQTIVCVIENITLGGKLVLLSRTGTCVGEWIIVRLLIISV